MTPVRFGPPSRRLFGLFHPADERRATGRAALLCNPFGHEAMRTHRFYRLLAERLSRQGVAVLRFDYHGTGDSPGTDEEGELIGWSQDILEAQRELMRRAGASQLGWFGARLGGRLALMAAPMAGASLQRMVLWDAVFDGTHYLQSLGRAHLDELELSHNIPPAGWQRSLDHDPLAFSNECLGFAISDTLRGQLLALKPETPVKLHPTQSVRLLAHPSDTTAARWAAQAKAQNPSANLEYTNFAHPLIWTSNPFASNEMVPAEAMQTMVAEIHGH